MNEDGANEDEHTDSWTRSPDRGNQIRGSGMGEARAIWCGPPVQPGEEWEAEWELPALFMSWVDIVPAPGGAFGLRIEGETVILTGVLEKYRGGRHGLSADWPRPDHVRMPGRTDGAGRFRRAEDP
ncbi:hypothetical protein ACFSQ7_47915 [Paenibacillus rhizoplanae]